jgi:XTP/dITP diphosphohydrolase
MTRELLIATTNAGKAKEILAFLEHMPFRFLTLNDIDGIAPPPEDTGTVMGNALQKARYYAQKTGHLTLADDAGLFISALNGWPGVDAALVPGSADEKMNVVLDELKKTQSNDRSAYWQSVLVLHDPESHVTFLAEGKTDGEILSEQRGNGGHGYDPLFYIPDLDKTYAELSVTEKNAISHRGKALIRIKHHLQNTYVAKHIVVPFALIIKDGKLLMNRRNDPHRPEYHDKWEFPGGKVEFGETMHENMMREVREEVGYDVEIVTMLQHIGVESQMQKTYAYQVFLVPYVCKIVGGDGKFSDGEVLETRWFGLDDVLNHELIGENARMYEQLLPELHEVIQRFHL